MYGQLRTREEEDVGKTFSIGKIFFFVFIIYFLLFLKISLIFYQIFFFFREMILRKYNYTEKTEVEFFTIKLNIFCIILYKKDFYKFQKSRIIFFLKKDQIPMETSKLVVDKDLTSLSMSCGLKLLEKN